MKQSILEESHDGNRMGDAGWAVLLATRRWTGDLDEGMKLTKKDLEQNGWTEDRKGNWRKDSKKHPGGQCPDPLRRRTPTKPKHDSVPKQVVPGPEEKADKNKCHVLVTVFRTRPIDPDNHFVKWHIDAIRRAGLLIDDDPTHIVLEIRQVKVKHLYEESVAFRITYPKGSPSG